MQQRQVRGQRGCGRHKRDRDTGTNEDTCQSWTPRRTTGNQETAAPSAKATRDVAGADADPKEGTGSQGTQALQAMLKTQAQGNGHQENRGKSG